MSSTRPSCSSRFPTARGSTTCSNPSGTIPDTTGGGVRALRTAFAVVDAFPNRTLYRYSYRGEWAPVVDSPVRPKLRTIDTVAGERVTLSASLAIPTDAERVSIRVATDADQAYYAVQGTPPDLPLRVVVANGSRTATHRYWAP